MYITYLGQTYSAKNQLEKAILEYLKSIDRTLVQDEDFTTFTSNLKTKIKSLNEKFPRCAPKAVKLWTPQGKDRKLEGVDVVNFYFYHIDKDFREGVVFIHRV